MVFSRLLTSGGFPVALEITPPQRSLPKVLSRRAALLGTAACAINVIQRPGRQSSLDASCELIASGLDPVWHLVTRGRTREEIAAELQRAADAGVQQLLIIRGDHQAEDPAGAPSIREVTAMARAHLPSAKIGATLNQYAPNAERVLRNLFPKLEAGASYVQTQPVFDLARLEALAARIREQAPETHIVAMAMPLLSLDAAEKMQSRIGLALPDTFRARLATADSAWAAFDEIVGGLAASEHIHGLAVMTFEIDAEPEVGERIVVSLRRAGISEPSSTDA